VGAALRGHGLFANTFHADEALFAGWARQIAVWRDPLLLTQAVDKPPLLFYLQALFYPLFGPVEFAARLPSWIASLLLIPLTAQLTRRLTGDRMAAALAAAVVAVAPLAVQFSATAFSDAPLTLWLVAALYTAARPTGAPGHGRAAPFAAGLLFGLALATKYQALLFAPLLVGVAWLGGWRGIDWRRALVGLAVVLAVVLLWQAARPSAGDLVALQWANVGGLRPARSWELWPRLSQGVELWRLAFGWPLFVLGAAALARFTVARHGPARLRPIEAALLLFIAGYVALHWLWAVPVWDRYLLPLLPLVALLIGRGLSGLWAAFGDRPARRWLPVALAALAVAHLPVAAAARAGRYPIGGQPAADGGAAVAALALRDAPYGTVLYDHWYSWHWRYQLFDSRVYVSWFPHADALLADLAAFGDVGPPRAIALPASDATRPVIRRLAEAGYRLEPWPGQESAGGVIIYQIID
jgi:4-amino-4-deoxy-L-arabinose transferase-like glycosyltransferase